MNSPGTRSGISSAGLLVVVIVAMVTVVVMATAIPSLLRSRDAGQPAAVTAQLKANEAGVIAALRTLHNAEAAYLITGSGVYGTFAELSAASLLDSTWTDTPVKNGYRLTIAIGTNGPGYCVTATRTSADVGDDSYSLSQLGAIYRLPGDTAPTCNPDTGLITLRHHHWPVMS